MKRGLLFLLLLITTLLPSTFQGYTVNIKVNNPYGVNLIISLEYNGTITLIKGNTSLNLPNVSVTLAVFSGQYGYDVFINNEKTTKYTFYPAEVNYVNISIQPRFVFVKIVVNGSGEVIVKFTNGSQLVVNQTTTLKLIQGSFLTLVARPIHDSFLGWSNYSAFNTLWITAQNSTIVANFGKVKGNTSQISQPQSLLGITLLLFLGGFYLLIKRKKSI